MEASPAVLNVNFDEMRAVVDVGLRRASAFLKIGQNGIKDIAGISFNLTTSLQYNFWPENIEAATVELVAREYDSWLVGACLRELDLFYGLFLDRVWWAIEVGELHGTSVRSDHQFNQSFAKDTSIANKQKKVADKLSIADHFDQLNSLGNARNCLAHHAGLVRARDCNNVERDTLTIAWRAADIFASRGGTELFVREMPFDTHQLPGDGMVQLLMRFDERSLTFHAGENIVLEQRQIAELCMFYALLRDEVLRGVSVFLASKGIVAPESKQEDFLAEKTDTNFQDPVN